MVCFNFNIDFVTIRRIIDLRVNDIQKRYPFLSIDREDLAQEFFLQFWKRFQKFDPRRSAISTFTFMTLVSIERNWWRNLMAMKRKGRLKEVPLLDSREDSHGMDFELAESDPHLPLLVFDLLQQLEPGLRCTAEAIRDCGGVTEATRMLGISRWQMYRRLQKIRKVLVCEK